MLTGHGGEESEVRCLEAGADDFVAKPINMAVLRARIETQLRLRSMRRQLEQQNDELEAWRTISSATWKRRGLPSNRSSLKSRRISPGWEVAACYRPVIQVGGDIYGWLRMNDGRICSGSPMQPAMALPPRCLPLWPNFFFIMAAWSTRDRPRSCEAVNQDFRSIFGARSFMTAMCVALDPEIGTRERGGRGASAASGRAK